ncbi:MAG: hypothetical protein R3F11_27755 [Verrucomicrobiales bacterium]
MLSAASVAETVADGEIAPSITVDDPDVGDAFAHADRRHGRAVLRW